MSQNPDPQNSNSAPPRRVRVKICGLTRSEDVREACRLGADALGFVFYPPSPRAVTIAQAEALLAEVPPFVTTVGLFVNPDPQEVESVLARAPLDLLQFHGDEPPELCRSFARPYLKALRVRPGLDLLELARRYPDAKGLLLDADSAVWGGSGRAFDWNLIPPGLPCPVVLAGGLTPETVAEAIARVRPWAVDVSSGVEAAKGIKCPQKMAAFFAAVTRGMR